jgi:hypothetical protein
MRVASLARFANDAGLHAQPGTDEVMMHGARGHQHGNWNPLNVHRPVGQEEQARAAFHCSRRFGANAVDCLFQARVTL